MPIFPGKMSYMGVGVQTNPTPVSPTLWLSVQGGGFLTQPNHQYQKEFRKQMESTSKPIRVGQETTGTIRTVAYPGGPLEWILKAAFGTVTTSAIVPATAYLHTYTVNQTDLPYYSIVQGLSNVTPDRFPGAKLKTLKVSLAEDQPIILDTEWVSMSVNRQLSELTPSYTTPAGFTYFDSAVTIDGVATTMVESLDMTIDRMTEASKTMNNSRDPTYILPNDFKTSGTMTLLFDGDSEYRRFLGNPSAVGGMLPTPTPVKLGMAFTGPLIVTGTPYQWAMSMEEVYYDRTTFDRLTDGTVKIGFDWTAAKPISSTPSLTCTLQTSSSPCL